MRTAPVFTLTLATLLPLAIHAAGPAAPRIRVAPLPAAGVAIPGRGGDDPRAIIVQGGLDPGTGCDGGRPTDSNGAVAIGPKQDDPAPPPSAARDAYGGMASGRGAIAIGPKQDDPVAPRPNGSRDAATGMASGRGAIAICPKQEDPATPPPRSGDLSSSMANGHGPIALGPKQDDPTPPAPESLIRCQPASH